MVVRFIALGVGQGVVTANKANGLEAEVRIKAGVDDLFAGIAET